MKKIKVLKKIMITKILIIQFKMEMKMKPIDIIKIMNNFMEFSSILNDNSKNYTN